jgi:hypothetical protein
VIAMTTQLTGPYATDVDRARAVFDLRGRSQRELVAASLLRCPNPRGAQG